MEMAQKVYHLIKTRDSNKMYSIAGKSSVGKSLLFESVVLVTGHQLLSSSSSSAGDAGVGRFHTGSKNTASLSFLFQIQPLVF